MWLQSCLSGYTQWRNIRSHKRFSGKDKAAARRWAGTEGGLVRSIQKSWNRWCWRGQGLFPRQQHGSARAPNFDEARLLLLSDPKPAAPNRDPATWGAVHWAIALPQQCAMEMVLLSWTCQTSRPYHTQHPYSLSTCKVLDWSCGWSRPSDKLSLRFLLSAKTFTKTCERMKDPQQ